MLKKYKTKKAILRQLSEVIWTEQEHEFWPMYDKEMFGEGPGIVLHEHRRNPMPINGNQDPDPAPTFKII